MGDIACTGSPPPAAQPGTWFPSRQHHPAPGNLGKIFPKFPTGPWFKSFLGKTPTQNQQLTACFLAVFDFSHGLLRAEPRWTRARAWAQSLGKTGATSNAAPSRTLVAQRPFRARANTTPPPGPQFAPTRWRPEPSRYRPRARPQAPHESAAHVALCTAHWARHSVMTFRNSPRVLTITPSSSRRSSRRSAQQRPLSNC